MPKDDDIKTPVSFLALNDAVDRHNLKDSKIPIDLKIVFVGNEEYAEISFGSDFNSTAKFSIKDLEFTSDHYQAQYLDTLLSRYKNIFAKAIFAWLKDQHPNVVNAYVLERERAKAD